MLNGVQDETPIYKFMALDYTLSMVKKRLLTIGRISSWPDVYENYMLKHKYMTSDGRDVGVMHLANGIYGQCWTVLPESDALWRIYSQNKDSIRIKTTVEKLYDSLYLTDSNMADTYIGKVCYKKQVDIDGHIQQLGSLDGARFQDEMVYGAFVKRSEFEHEHEVRIIKILDSKNTNPSLKFLQYPISDDFIDEFCIDPRVDKNTYEALKKQLLEAGVQPKLICQSPLYHFNKYTLTFK